MEKNYKTDQTMSPSNSDSKKNKSSNDIENKKISFPKNFYWGSATASHQVEGGNFNDWSEWEKNNADRLANQAKDRYGWMDIWEDIKPEVTDPNNYISGIACDHYNRYEEDFDLMRQLNLNAYRFSIEWSRIEPEEGKFNEKEIEHYKRFITALEKRGIEPFVTIWHWPIPLWLRDKGGWLSPDITRYFERYSKKLVEELPGVKYWITINEPHINSVQAYFRGEWPPAYKSFPKYHRVINNMIKTHNNTYKAIKKINPNLTVGIAKNNFGLIPYKNTFYNKIAKNIIDWWWNRRFLNKTQHSLDFIGLNYYFNEEKDVFGRDKKLPKEFSDMGFEINPKGIYSVLMQLKDYNKPIFITESGVADREDKIRKDYIYDILKSTHKAIQDGLGVRGHFYWSIIDNFEWDRGFAMKFGLIEVDYKNNLKRKVRDSGWYYGNIAKNNSLNL